MKCADCDNEAISGSIMLCSSCMSKSMENFDPNFFKTGHCDMCGVKYWYIGEDISMCGPCMDKLIEREENA